MFITTAWDLEGFEHEILRAQLKIKRFGRIVRVTKTFVVKDTEVERSLPLCSNKHTHSVSFKRSIGTARQKTTLACIRASNPH